MAARADFVTHIDQSSSIEVLYIESIGGDGAFHDRG